MATKKSDILATELTRDQDTALDVGKRIRLLREQRGLSLRALAERCGLSLNAISKIERGENSPTVASLHLLASALNVPITEFFQAISEQTVVYVRGNRRLRSQNGGMDIESLGMGLRNQQLEPFLVTLEPGSGVHSEPITHPGQEFVYCLEGEICYEIESEVYRLQTGDSLLFEAAQPHRLSNASAAPALILLVFQTHESNQTARQRHLDT